jgi:hypothetical protein
MYRGPKAAMAVLFFVSLLHQQSGLAQAADESGLSLTIRCTTNVLRVGDEIPIELTISNHATNDYNYRDRTHDHIGRMSEYKLIAKTASRESVPDPRMHFKPTRLSGASGPRVLHPGESFSKIIPLNRWALMKLMYTCSPAMRR